MKCSHGLPYELKCKQCVDEALTRVRTMQQQPVEQATPEQRTAFFAQAFRVAHSRDKRDYE